MQTLFPAIKPFAQHRLTVEEPHELYVEECGSPDGLPVLFVHGGPGIGCTLDDRRYFDPDSYRIILFDQRGCGRSTPHGELQHNKTQALVEDIEAIRKFLKIRKWILFGGSWGSTLSLVYAQAHPRNVMALVLRGIFLGRKKDLQWLYQDGASRLFPDYWEEFTAPIPKKEQKEICRAYYQRLTGDNEVARMRLAKVWSAWEGRCSALQPSANLMQHFLNPYVAPCLAKIESYYFMNHCFLRSNQIIRNMSLIRKIPGVIVHGRYDAICAIDNAWALHKAWPGSDLQVIRDAGHTASEPGITDALVRAMKDLAKRFDD